MTHNKCLGVPNQANKVNNLMPLTSEGAGWGKVCPYAVEIGRNSLAAAHLTWPEWLVGKGSASWIHKGHAPTMFCPTP